MNENIAGKKDAASASGGNDEDENFEAYLEGMFP